ncbi:phosphoribosylformylglycinamidine synthase II [Methanocaldococcus infernus ME]|uniref:Phosphoribosylformylglycinamidine synthase subunit PurL n=1 Tax=Methanocaldococcus infernus (strain DSM 11812 / JCM 15783 / ME) TaxID=573063 RepID=D5VRG1_METIM|nr:phosphoribosylformylglycinamidine synthase subunit PurL [Methanocaldococcus infernus]ADG13164.1 phosphoribosylformylglycinamidine synthase II [Methanocaldococcus infernus ME]
MDENDLKYIQKTLGREINEIEKAMFENLWSEHCSYRTSKKLLRMFSKTINERTSKDIVVGIGDDAAVIRLKDNICLALAMESHNHPSYIDPYNGAATGVGGIVRDVLSMGAKPIALLDPLRFGDPRVEKVRWLIDGVVRGIGDYGNRIGVPTVGGECEFDESFNYNNLVNVVCVGLVKEEDIVRGKTKEKELSLILVGSTGRDGIGGASFASKDLTEESEEERPSVQVGDAFSEKCLIDAILEAVKTKKVKAMKDLGAAGLSGAATEMCLSGCELYLENVPLREPLTPYEIMVSESQERMLLAVEKGSEEEIIKIFEKYDLPAAVIGRTTDTGRIIAKYKGEVVVDLPISLLCNAPLYDREEEERILEKEGRIEERVDLEEAILKLLESPNICSKEWIYSQYDYDVQLRTVIKPGRDAAVLRILETYPVGIALTVDCNSRFCKLNPYVGSLYTVAEAVRNLACVGAKPLAMLDNLNFANPEKPDRFWQLKECIRGLADAAFSFDIPVVGGNVSLYNETVIEGKEYPINPTPAIALIGKIDNIEKVPGVLDNKVEEGDILIITNETKEEMGGSEYYKVLFNSEIGRVPRVNLEKEKEIYKKVVSLINRGLISGTKDCSRGGLGIALAKFCINNNIGVEVELDNYNINKLREDLLLFSETSGRIILAVKEENLNEVLKEIDGYVIGRVGGKELSIKINNNKISISLGEMKKVYKEAFPKMMGEL